MEDNKIIDLYWKRSETAISETSKNTENIAAASLIIFCMIMKIVRNV